MKPRLLDLFCGAGGAAAGYARAGFDIVGIDHVAQPNYPYTFIEGDALQVAEWAWPWPCGFSFPNGFDVIHASPPCQFYASLSKGDHWRSIPPTRELLDSIGLPYVIENIQDAAWDMRQSRAALRVDGRPACPSASIV
jgi:DNA (cytosine-5)-methyltransferase 1